jgi:microcystin-dependent protein
MPQHARGLSGTFSFEGDTGNQSTTHTHRWYGDKNRGGAADTAYNAGNNGVSKYRRYNTDPETTNHTHSFSGSISLSGNTGNSGSSYAHNNLQPYITCYMWKRTS